jgi:hypothetical protein
MSEIKDPEQVQKDILETLRRREITDLNDLAKWTATEITRVDERGNPLVGAVLAGSWYVLVS